MARATLIALCDEVHNIRVSWREWKELGQHGLDLLMRDKLAVSLVEKSEALLGLLILACLGSDALIPVVGYDMLYKLEVHAVTLKDLRVALLKLIFNIAWAHLMEAKILQNVPEEVVRDGVLVLLKVVVEALLKICGHLRWQIANVGLLGCLGTVLHLLILGVPFLVHCHLLVYFGYKFEL